MAPQPRKQIMIVGNGVQITGCLIHRVTKYRGFQDACVRFSFPILPYHKQNCHNSNRFKVFVITGCSIRVDRALKVSLCSMCVMANGYLGFKIIVARLLE